MVEACVASHCYRLAKTYYFKGQGEIDVIMLQDNTIQAIEVKWSSQLRANDLKHLKQFKDSIILTKNNYSGVIDGIQSMPVYDFLHDLPMAF
jgi:predicted AAA+ superfamily ATPase